jgi:hypothetical protein
MKTKDLIEGGTGMILYQVTSHPLK